MGHWMGHWRVGKELMESCCRAVAVSQMKDQSQCNLQYTFILLSYLFFHVPIIYLLISSHAKERLFFISSRNFRMPEEIQKVRSDIKI